MKRVHIVGLSPRTGTTLMMELMANCFQFDAYSSHETSLALSPDRKVNTICTKQPKELKLLIDSMDNSNLWGICLVRDPRDTIVSKHKLAPDAYWINLKFYKDQYKRLLQTTKSLDRLILIQYEKLVSEPDTIQDMLEARIPFLQRKARFSEFHNIAKPKSGAEEALGGVRKISSSSVGNWKKHLPRVKAQINKYGDICDMLIDFEYEKDKAWLNELTNVKADNGVDQSEMSLLKYIKKLEKKIRRSLKEVLGLKRKKQYLIYSQNYQDHM